MAARKKREGREKEVEKCKKLKSVTKITAKDMF